MLGLNGKLRNCFETMLKGVGFPLLLVALVLAAGMPSARSFPSAVPGKMVQSFIAGEGAHAAAMRASPVLVDLSGWELYLHSATKGLSSFALSPSAGTLSVAGNAAAAHGMASQPPPPLRLRVPYRPQAPPFRV